jgi:hypothetical protein
MKNVVFARSVVFALVLLSSASVTHAQSLLLSPRVEFSDVRSGAPKSYWGKSAVGYGTFQFSSPEGILTCTMEAADAIARLQFGTVGLSAGELAKYYGKTVRVSVKVKGNIVNLDKDGLGPLLMLELSRSGKGVKLQSGPFMTPSADSTRPPRVEPTVGNVPPTTLEIITTLPQGTDKLLVICYLHNAQGLLEWSDLKAEVLAEPAQVTHPVPVELPLP